MLCLRTAVTKKSAFRKTVEVLFFFLVKGQEEEGVEKRC